MQQVEYELKEQKVGKSLYDVEEVYSQLVTSTFSDKIETIIPL